MNKTLSPILDKIKVAIAMFAASAGVALGQTSGTTMTPGTKVTGLGGLMTVNASFLVLAMALIVIGLFLLLGSEKYRL